MTPYGKMCAQSWKRIKIIPISLNMLSMSRKNWKVTQSLKIETAKNLSITLCWTLRPKRWVLSTYVYLMLHADRKMIPFSMQCPFAHHFHFLTWPIYFSFWPLTFDLWPLTFEGYYSVSQMGLILQAGVRTRTREPTWPTPLTRWLWCQIIGSECSVLQSIPNEIQKWTEWLDTF